MICHKTKPSSHAIMFTFGFISLEKVWTPLILFHYGLNSTTVILLGCVTWSTTERREIRNFPYSSVFELACYQRLTVKRGIRNVGQFLAAEVTNPGQNESQQTFALCDRVKKIVVRPNRLQKKEAKWLARILKRK